MTKPGMQPKLRKTYPKGMKQSSMKCNRKETRGDSPEAAQILSLPSPNNPPSLPSSPNKISLK